MKQPCDKKCVSVSLSFHSVLYLRAWILHLTYFGDPMRRLMLLAPLCGDNEPELYGTIYVTQICHGFIADPRCSSAPTALLKTQSRIVLFVAALILQNDMGRNHSIQTHISYLRCVS